MRRPRLEIGVAATARPGEAESGDLHLVKPVDDGVVVLVLDGLGHGPEAAVAAQKAVQTLHDANEPTVIALFRRCHEALRSTRGAVMSLAWFNAIDESVTWLGVGNVEGRLWRADSAEGAPFESLLLRPGLLGHQLPPLHGALIQLRLHDTLVLATDGVRVGALESVRLTDPPQANAQRIMAAGARGTDDALVLVARYEGIC